MNGSITAQPIVCWPTQTPLFASFQSVHGSTAWLHETVLMKDLAIEANIWDMNHMLSAACSYSTLCNRVVVDADDLSYSGLGSYFGHLDNIFVSGTLRRRFRNNRHVETNIRDMERSMGAAFSCSTYCSNSGLRSYFGYLGNILVTGPPVVIIIRDVKHSRSAASSCSTCHSRLAVDADEIAFSSVMFCRWHQGNTIESGQSSPGCDDRWSQG